MLKILNTILFVACENSDGLMDFNYSHDGYWLGHGTYKDVTTKMECANTCMKRYEEDGGCLAISFYSTTTTSYCYHYSYGQFIQSNKMISTLEKAYAKCLGTDV